MADRAADIRNPMVRDNMRLREALRRIRAALEEIEDLLAGGKSD